MEPFASVRKKRKVSACSSCDLHPHRRNLATFDADIVSATRRSPLPSEKDWETERTVGGAGPLSSSPRSSSDVPSCPKECPPPPPLGRSRQGGDAVLDKYALVAPRSLSEVVGFSFLKSIVAKYATTRDPQHFPHIAVVGPYGIGKTSVFHHVLREVYADDRQLMEQYTCFITINAFNKAVNELSTEINKLMDVGSLLHEAERQNRSEIDQQRHAFFSSHVWNAASPPPSSDPCLNKERPPSPFVSSLLSSEKDAEQNGEDVPQQREQETKRQKESDVGDAPACYSFEPLSLLVIDEIQFATKRSMDHLERIIDICQMYHLKPHLRIILITTNMQWCNDNAHTLLQRFRVHFAQPVPVVEHARHLYQLCVNRLHFDLSAPGSHDTLYRIACRHQGNIRGSVLELCRIGSFHRNTIPPAHTETLPWNQNKDVARSILEASAQGDLHASFQAIVQAERDGMIRTTILKNLSNEMTRLDVLPSPKELCALSMLAEQQKFGQQHRTHGTLLKLPSILACLQNGRGYGDAVRASPLLW
mmetsp:Transcript_15285/g.38597  ORF Transcript_15285/g.38597 Transcript_15285/m.38597 type:complete len:533 (-) Transcript_15285:611-2209(-)